MGKRSLQASETGRAKARKAFKRKAWTQEYLAGVVGVETRQPIWKFFTGKPVDRHIFIEICFQLGLEWQEIAEVPGEDLLKSKAGEKESLSDIEDLLKAARSQHSAKIQVQCGTMRLLDIPRPINLEDIYINVNILDGIVGERWLDISDLQDLNLDPFDRVKSELDGQENIPALEAVITYPKLMIFGKPGSGKTTFLQHVALQCSQGALHPDRLPIFIKLKNFAEQARESGDFSLFHWIEGELNNSQITSEKVKRLIEGGKLLILLDGLDEVRDKESGKILKSIGCFSENFYKNNLILTSRIAANQCRFEGFTDLQLADFNKIQIEAFVGKWFAAACSHSRSEGLAKASQFLEKLRLPENRSIRELAVTPLLLHLTCLVFQTKANFPTKRTELYKQGLDILLVRWDKARGIQRDEMYGELSLPHKLKLLAQIAAKNFENGRYFIEQSTLQQQIEEYLRSRTGTSADPEVLQVESEAVLKSIEVQHGLLVERARGIYSFSHLTFQEYLTARKYAFNPEPQALEENLNELASHLSDPGWHEVFGLTAGMLGNADELLRLMKRQADAIAAADEQLQQFLAWVNRKSVSVRHSGKKAAVRAFYLTLELKGDLGLDRHLMLPAFAELILTRNLAPQQSLDLALSRLLARSASTGSDPSAEQILALGLAFPGDRLLACDPDLKRALQPLQVQLLDAVRSGDNLQNWWNAWGQTWVEALRAAIVEHRDIGRNWQFSDLQRQLLQRYCEASQFLIDFLHSDLTVTPRVREEIWETLFLPIAEMNRPMECQTLPLKKIAV